VIVRRFGRTIAAISAGLAFTGAGLAIVHFVGASSSGLANLWFGNAGTCTPSASPVAYNPATSCSTPDAAVAAASCGYTIGVNPGSYAAAYTISFHAATAACTNNPITFITPNGNSIFTGAFKLSTPWVKILGTYQTLTQMWLGGRAGFDFSQITIGFGSSGPPNDIGHDWLENVNMHFFDISAAHDTEVKNSQIGPFDHAGCPSCQDNSDTTSEVWVTTPYPSYNNTFDGVFWHDNYDSSGGADPGHTDCLQTDGYMNLKIVNSVFLNCADEPILINVFAATGGEQTPGVCDENHGCYQGFVAAGHDPLAGGDFENDVFFGGVTTQPVQIGSPAGADFSSYGAVCNGNGTLEGGGTQVQCKGDDTGFICHNIIFRYDDVIQAGNGDIAGINCAAGTSAGARSAQATVEIEGNIFPQLSPLACSIAVCLFNRYVGFPVQSGDTNSTTGTLASLQFANSTTCQGYNTLCTGSTATPFDFHIGASSAAIGKGNPSDFPATDFYGTARSSPPDVGATAH
jgi:hypothetical protein